MKWGFKTPNPDNSNPGDRLKKVSRIYDTTIWQPYTQEDIGNLYSAISWIHLYCAGCTNIARIVSS